MSAARELPCICVFGATGQQGGSVARALYQTGQWRIRAVTRDVNTEKARQLSAELPGIDLVVADMLDRSAVRRALNGCKAVFLVTDFYTQRNIEKAKRGLMGETEEGCVVVDAAKEVGVEWMIFSTLHDVKQITGGKFTVPHFTGKSMVEQRARDIGLKTLAVAPGVFCQNFSSGLFPAIHVTPRGLIEWRLPLRHDVALPLIDISQFGLYVAHALRNPQDYVDKRILCASEYLTLDQCAAIYTQISGVPTVYKRQSMEEYRESAKNVPYVDEYVEMFSYFNEFGYYNGETLHHTLEHFPPTRSFREWLVHSGWRTDLGTAPKVASALGMAKGVGPQHTLGAEKGTGLDFEKRGTGAARQGESASSAGAIGRQM